MAESSGTATSPTFMSFGDMKYGPEVQAAARKKKHLKDGAVLSETIKVELTTTHDYCECQTHDTLDPHEYQLARDMIATVLKKKYDFDVSRVSSRTVNYEHKTRGGYCRLVTMFYLTVS